MARSKYPTRLHRAVPIRKGLYYPPLHRFLLNHIATFSSSFQRLAGAPIATLLTSTVIGIALALPMGLLVMLDDVRQLSAHWDVGAQISLFLKQEVTPAQAVVLAERLRSRPDIAAVKYLSSQQALEEFQQLSGFGDALTLLGENPLPAVLVIEPSDNHPRPLALEDLIDSLRKMAGVELAQLDMQWLKRLSWFIELGRRGVLMIAALLAIAILLITGNTIRLTIQNRIQEIEVSKFIGATDAFIRRPFLYSGFWYGLFGAIIAWLLLLVFFWGLSEPVQNLSLLYGSNFKFAGLNFTLSATLLGSGALLGLLGSWLVVRRHLKAIEPC